jgi:hypothetical protein
MPVEHQLRLHSTSISGLSASDRQRVEEIGLDAWMDETIERQQVTQASIRKADIPSGRRCALASKCLKARNRQAEYIREGNGKYCSPVCRGAAMAAKQRKKAQWRADNPEMA